MRRLTVLCLVVLAAGAACADWPVRLFGTNLRTVDWERTLNGDPNFISSPMPSLSGLSGRFIETPDGAVSGFVQTKQVSYGDISGDGREEAFIPVVRDGPAGVTGVLVYRPSDRGAVFVGAVGGLAMRYEVRDGALWTWSAARVGWEHPCCPSGLLERVYRLKDSELRLVRETLAPREQARLPTVLRYYQLIGERKLEEAYQLLSSGYRARESRLLWEEAVGRQDLVAVTARDEPDGRVAVEVIENDPNEPRTRLSIVVWSLVWSPEAKHWQLDRAEVRSAS